MAPLTLADYAKLAAASNDTLKLGVVQVFREESKVLDMLSFSVTGELDVKFMRAKSMPQPAFRKIGAAYSSTKGDLEPVEDRIYLLGGNIDVDKALERARSVVNTRAFHEQLQLKAIARTFNDYFINGDPTSDVDGVTGLWYRLQNDLPSGQQINAALDISPDTAVANWESKLIDAIEELMDNCVEGQADTLLMDRYTKLRLEAAFRKSNLLATTTDQLGRKFNTYGSGGPAIVSMGYKRDETSTSAGTKIIGHVENGLALTGGAQTSIYAAKFGKEFLGGAEEYNMDVVDKGELDDGVTYRTVVDWPMGIYILNPRSVARLYGITAV